MKARILRGGLWPARFRAGCWYAAELTEDGDAVVLRKGRARTTRALVDVEIRTTPDDAWEVRSASRLSLERDGQRTDYPGRVAECPEGHTRTIPSRFDAPVVMLRCPVCALAYRLTDG